MKPPAGLELIHLNTCLKGKRGCILNLIKIMIDDRKIVIFPFGKGGGKGGEASKWTRICTSLYTLHV